MASRKPEAGGKPAAMGKPAAQTKPAGQGKQAGQAKPQGRPADGDQGGERLQKFIARCGIASRREAEELIQAGRVEVNDALVTELGTRVDPETDVVRVDGERIKPLRDRLVILLNKPVGYLCAASDPESRPLVYHLVPKNLALRTIGRLDFNTEGVLLFTNDGDLAERLGHARYAVQRVYEARVRGVPSEETLAKLRRGVRLEDGPARAESAELVKVAEQNAWVRLTLIEGRNREVRRLMERVGHPVVRLRRIQFAGLTTEGLKLGQWRRLGDDEVHQLETRGHVGSFELPPDPRRKGQLPGLSTGTPRSDRQAARRREPKERTLGTGRPQGEMPPPPGKPTHTRGDGPRPPGKPSKPMRDRPTPAGKPTHTRGEGPRPPGKPSKPVRDRPTPAGKPTHTRGEGPRPAGKSSHQRGDAPPPARKPSRPKAGSKGRGTEA